MPLDEKVCTLAELDPFLVYLVDQIDETQDNLENREDPNVIKTLEERINLLQQIKDKYIEVKKL